MADKDELVNVDLTCMRRSVDDVLTKNGEKNSVFAIYKGTIEIEGVILSRLQLLLMSSLSLIMRVLLVL